MTISWCFSLIDYLFLFLRLYVVARCAMGWGFIDATTVGDLGHRIQRQETKVDRRCCAARRGPNPRAGAGLRSKLKSCNFAPARHVFTSIRCPFANPPAGNGRVQQRRVELLSTNRYIPVSGLCFVIDCTTRSILQLGNIGLAYAPCQEYTLRVFWAWVVDCARFCGIWALALLEADASFSVAPLSCTSWEDLAPIRQDQSIVPNRSCDTEDARACATLGCLSGYEALPAGASSTYPAPGPSRSLQYLQLSTEW